METAALVRAIATTWTLWTLESMLCYLQGVHPSCAAPKVVLGVSRWSRNLERWYAL